MQLAQDPLLQTFLREAYVGNDKEALRQAFGNWFTRYQNYLDTVFDLYIQGAPNDLLNELVFERYQDYQANVVDEIDHALGDFGYFTHELIGKLYQVAIFDWQNAINGMAERNRIYRQHMEANVLRDITHQLNTENGAGNQRPFFQPSNVDEENWSPVGSPTAAPLFGPPTGRNLDLRR